MSISKWLILATLAGAVVGGSACTEKAADQTTNTTGAVLDTTKRASDTVLEATKEGVDKAIDATKKGAATVIDETKEAGEKTGEKTKEIAGKIADKSKDVASAAGEAITDGWITTKVSAKFADETLLKGSNINVDTNNHAVTLTGTVGSNAANARAVAIAGGTEGVTRVVNQLVVRVR